MPFGSQLMLLFVLFPRFGSVCGSVHRTSGSAEQPNRTEKFGRTLEKLEYLVEATLLIKVSLNESYYHDIQLSLCFSCP